MLRTITFSFNVLLLAVLGVFPASSQNFQSDFSVAPQDNHNNEAGRLYMDVRLLLNYFYGGEMMTGFFRSNFESNFENVGYFNSQPNIEEWRAFDVILTKLGTELSEVDVETIKEYLNLGGGLMIFKSGFDREANQLKKIDDCLEYDNVIRPIGDGYVQAQDRYENLGTGGSLRHPLFDEFLVDIDSLSTKRLGDRTIPAKTYYGNDTTLVNPEVEIVCEKSRSGAYQTTDLPEMLDALYRLENFTGIDLHRKITVSIRPTALEFGIFVWGVTNSFDRIAFCYPSGLGGIFAHECAHIFEHELNDKYSALPAFGLGIIQMAAEGRDFGYIIVNGKIDTASYDKRAVWLWYAFIDLVGTGEMYKLFNSLEMHLREFIPSESYWNSINAFPEDSTAYFQQAINMINYYMSKAFDTNFTSQVENWGYEEINDWVPAESDVYTADSLYQNLSASSEEEQQLRAQMWKAFYKGLFEEASILAEELAAMILTTNVADITNLPKRFELSQNYPNPFNPQTTIEYNLARTGEVRLALYNLRGQLIKILVNGKQNAGRYSVQWNGTDALGRNVASGIYLYRLEAGQFVADKKLALIR